MSAAEADAQQRRWRILVDERLPEAAAAHPDWPVTRNHCFARILLDNACGGPWRESVAPPAWANMPPERLALAVSLGEAVLAGRQDLAALNRRSLLWRRKRPVAPPPKGLSGDGFSLRRWRLADDGPFAALCADPEVMRFFPAPKTARESQAEARALDRRFEEDGFGPWAVEAPEGFAGFVGCWRPARPLPLGGLIGRETGLVEIGWRLARSAWGRGFAVRGARLALADAFTRCALTEIVAYTADRNGPSRRVMERLGMSEVGGFDHPGLPEGHSLRPHRLYRLAAADFLAGDAV
ncbi:GNAT family N-acetyltransferase [Methylobacterium platani]|uniref:GCN5 family acetyltransferase n=2 Tax=Methylobacterium platani TaxID=427683 RepID=A0A179S3L0_9HYPH|nr:GNAT family N-acetyltransferase [Methylobacterium platani]KMO17336.1 GCN5 family acetyltransferase [Methylobacterium platani JCM 14648]OAS18332.1 GCN5 family acetyltransferase [Methylobacterium platani]